MKRILVLILLFFSIAGRAQNVITYHNSTMYLNGKPFFLLGFYYAEGPTELASIANGGANTALVGYNGVIDTYDSNGVYTATHYASCLLRELNDAQTNNTKIIVELPMYLGGDHIFGADSGWSFIDTVVGNSSIRNHSSLLGWYIADEPERDSALAVPRSFLERRYVRIKSKDSNHPTFVVFANSGYFSGNYLSPRKIYDVLMADHYPCDSNTAVPAPELATTPYQASQLETLFRQDKSTDSGSTVFVPQGFGGSFHKRNPAPCEIKYQGIASIIRAQHDSVGSSGGLLYWRTGRKDTSSRTDEYAFIKFLTGNGLDTVVRQQNLYSLVSSTEWQVVPMLRYSNGYFYLFASNDTDRVVITALDLNIGNAISCTELGVPSGADTTRILYSRGSGVYRDSVYFSRRQARVFKIKYMADSVAGPSLASLNLQRGQTHLTFAWSAVVTGGVSPYTYSWKVDQTSIGTSSSLSLTYYYNGSSSTTPDTNHITLTVTDSKGRSVTYTKTVLAYQCSYLLAKPQLNGSNDGNSDIPTSFSLDQNYPNPFNPSTRISFGLPEPATIRISITDILGRRVATLMEGSYGAGFHQVQWDGENSAGKKIGSGVYFYYMTAVGQSGKQFTKIMKMLMLK